MKKSTFYSIFGLLTALITGSAFVVQNSGGKPGYTGSPGETYCNSCHSGGSDTTHVIITSIPAFNSNQYMPGDTYTINITVENTAYNLFGFGAEVLFTQANTDAGVMLNPGNGVKFMNATNGRKNAVHQSPQSGTGFYTFSFDWVAPTNGQSVTIYAAGNAVNGNGATSGDRPATSSLTITAASTGITTIENQNVHLFPNPANDHFYIEWNNPLNVNMVNIKLTDIHSKQIYELASKHALSGNNRFKVDIPDYVKTGVYIVTINDRQEILASRMLLINR